MQDVIFLHFRLHSSFVPMFGCVASELVDTKSAHNSELGDSSENK